MNIPKNNAPAETPVVYVIDDDPAMRESMDSLIRSFGLQVMVFSHPQSFLNCQREQVASCIILDVRLHQSSGLEFQTELNRLNIHIPVIFISGHGDIAMTVRAMKAGAIDFLTKPFRDQDLFDAVMEALEKDRQRRQSNDSHARLKNCYESLTCREKQVMELAVSGLMNKQIASQLDISLITVKIHRANAMKKMQAKTFADLVKKSELLNLS